MTDPIADMLTRLRNANSAYHDTVSMPSSKLKVNIAEMLKAEGYIAGYEVTDAEVGKTLTLSLKYGANRQRAIQGLRRISKPGLRVYAKSTNLPKVPSRTHGLAYELASRQQAPPPRDIGRRGLIAAAPSAIQQRADASNPLTRRDLLAQLRVS